MKYSSLVTPRLAAGAALAVAGALLGALPYCGCGTESALGGKNVVILLVDALRRDHVGAFGSKKGLTPNMDRLAREGFTFHRAVAPCSWTRPSVASLMTGLYPGRHGVVAVPNCLGRGANALNPGLATLAERVQTAGYGTAAFVTNSHVIPAFQFHQGFDDFTQPAGRAQELVERALGWIRARNGAEPFFLYLHLIDPHAPYDPPEDFRKRHDRGDPGPGALFEREGNPVGLMRWCRQYEAWRTAGRGAPFRFDDGKLISDMLDRYDRLTPEQIRSRVRLGFSGLDDPDLLRRADYLASRYEGEVAYADAAVGRFIEGLKAEGLLDETILVVTGDHGEAFLEHGQWGHNGDLHREKVDIPLVIRAPGPDGAYRGASREPVSLVDLYPTLLDMLRLPPSDGLQGLSLWPLIREPDRAVLPARPVISENILRDREHVAAVMGGGKLIFNRREDGGPEWLYYEADDDPEETKPADPEEGGAQAAALKETIERWIRERTLDAGGAAHEQPLTDEEKEQMKALGYF